MLVPLLAVNIATTVRVADSNLLNALRTLPEDDAFGFLQRLDDYGKKLRHENKWTLKKDDTPAFLRGNVLKFIQALLPDYDNPATVVADLSNTSNDSRKNFVDKAERISRRNFAVKVANNRVARSSQQVNKFADGWRKILFAGVQKRTGNFGSLRTGVYGDANWWTVR